MGIDSGDLVLFDADSVAAQVHHDWRRGTNNERDEAIRRLIENKKRTITAEQPVGTYPLLVHDLNGNGTFDYPFHSLRPDTLAGEIEDTLVPLLFPDEKYTPPSIFYIHLCGMKLIVYPAQDYVSAVANLDDKHAQKIAHMVREYLMEHPRSTTQTR